MVGELLQAKLLQSLLTEVVLPITVSLIDETPQGSVLDDGLRIEQSLGEHVDSADVAVEQVDRIDRLTADLRIEVEPSAGHPAAFENVQHGERQPGDIVGELIGVPTILRIAAVDVDRPKDAARNRSGDLMLE